MEIFSKMFTVSIQIKPAAHCGTLYFAASDSFFLQRRTEKTFR